LSVSEMAMNTRKESCRGPATALALLTVAGLAWLSTAQASAQVGGSLIVTITSPTAGSTVSGTIPVVATVSMLGGLTVQGVQFKVDGANIGAEDTTAPYSVPWDTKAVATASHTLSAVARDAAGNTATSTVTVTVDNVVPTVSITAPGGGAVVAGTTVVSASATDNVGVSGVQFLVDGSALGAEVTTAPYTVSWDTTTVATGAHSLTAVARDGAGNTTTSGAVTVTVSQTATRFEDTDLSIVYTDGVTAPGQPAGWWHGSRSRTWSNKTASFNRSQGAQARFSFTGTTVRWIGFLAPWAGIARVYVDDVFVTELDLYQPTEQTQAVVFSRTGLTNGPHSLTVESTGRKNASSVDYAVVVDAFDVAPALPLPAPGRHTLTINVTGTANAAATGSTIVVDALDTRARIEDADASVTYTSDWRQSNFDKDWSGASPNTGTGSVALSRTAGGQATLS